MSKTKYDEYAEVLERSDGFPQIVEFDYGGSGVARWYAANEVIVLTHFHHPDVKEGWTVMQFFHKDGTVEEIYEHDQF